jgi:hypothetical protein
MKAIYKLKKTRSNFHRFLNEEGIGINMLANHLEMVPMTVRNYLDSPIKFKVQHLIGIQELLEIETGETVDYNFMVYIIQGN